ncbi:MAG: murein L,D-transpeptidase family protein [Candidatus Roizmanbacteria bacterium]|nr:murein L,D-transpeptidase family protein [Candidatus Roizmanbacteria bacterium]
MKRIVYIAILIALVGISSPAKSQEIPSSKRSKEAISLVRPRLEKELGNAKLTWGLPIYIRIFKEEKELEIWLQDGANFKKFKTYPICTYGFGSLGPKVRKGDSQAPEGFYTVTANRLNPVSNFHLSFDLGYPNEYDRIHKRTGSALMVHGSCVSIGCYAMTDKRIEEIYAMADAAIRNGQRFFQVHIFPFRMTDENMKRHAESEWTDFWKNLKEGYDIFEGNGHRPPDVTVKNQRYVFR